MRVIAGELRGKRLQAPEDEAVRPTTDRVKESMFNLISGVIDEDTVVIDLFAGTGGLGIEALSRGAKKAYFCDNSKKSYYLIKQNIKDCRLEDRSEIVFGDYRKTTAAIGEKADLVFLDPPYGLDLWKKAADSLIENGCLADGAAIVMEHGADNPISGLDERIELIKEKKYGAILVSVFRYNED